MSDDEFFEIVGQDSDEPRYWLCDRIVADAATQQRRQCRFVLTNLTNTPWTCGLCHRHKLAACDCGISKTNCDRRECPRVLNTSD